MKERDVADVEPPRRVRRDRDPGWGYVKAATRKAWATAERERYEQLCGPVRVRKVAT